MLWVLFVQLFLIFCLSVCLVISLNYTILIALITNAFYVHIEISILNIYKMREKLLNFTWFQIIALPLVYISIDIAVITDLLYIPAIFIGLWEICLLVSILKCEENKFVLFYGVSIFLYISSALTYYVFISAKMNTFFIEVWYFCSIFIFFVICALDLQKISIEIKGAV